jgi:NADH-quinone oxidoreductase subunit H
MLSYEVFMGLSLMGVVMQAGSFNLREIVEAQRQVWFVVPQFVGFVVFFIAGIAETHRLPSICRRRRASSWPVPFGILGLKFGMFFVGEYLGITYFGDYDGCSWRMDGAVPPLAWFLIKTFLSVSSCSASLPGRGTISSCRSGGK